jgi:hypothetical protein
MAPVITVLFHLFAYILHEFHPLLLFVVRKVVRSISERLPVHGTSSSS